MIKMEEINIEQNNNKSVVKIQFSNGTKTCFSLTDEKIGEIPIFKDASNKILDILLKNEEMIKHICEKYSHCIILGCSHVFLKKVVRFTKEYEIDLNVCITKDREILHYVAYGYELYDENKIIMLLLISYDE